MKNRAKCKKCKDIIESKYGGYVSCNCGEIAIWSNGEDFLSEATDYSNFLRVDDEGNEIEVITKFSENKSNPVPNSKSEILHTIDDMIEKMEEMPSTAMTTYINHYDYVSLLKLISSLFKSV